MSTMRNQVMLIGNLGSDPEIKEFGDNGKLAKVSLATNETYKNQKGEKVTETQWHNLVAWGRTAELFQKYVTKGQQIAISGKLVNRSFEKDGQTRYVTEVVVNDLLLLGSKD